MHIPQVDDDLHSRIAGLKLMIFDVDGVMTDGSIIYHDDGSETKVFDVKDGHGIKLLLRSGLDAAIVTGRQSRVVEHRARDLGIRLVYQKIHRKVDALEDIIRKTGLRDSELGYIGDDLIDLPVMLRVGLSVAVCDASPHLFPHAHYVTRAPGGHGACREVCELILQVQDRWKTVTERYFGEAGRRDLP